MHSLLCTQTLLVAPIHSRLHPHSHPHSHPPAWCFSYAAEVDAPAGLQTAIEIMRHVEPDSELTTLKLYATCADIGAPLLQSEIASVRSILLARHVPVA